MMPKFVLTSRLCERAKAAVYCEPLFGTYRLSHDEMREIQFAHEVSQVKEYSPREAKIMANSVLELLAERRRDAAWTEVVSAVRKKATRTFSVAKAMKAMNAKLATKTMKAMKAMKIICR